MSILDRVLAVVPENRTFSVGSTGVNVGVQTPTMAGPNIVSIKFNGTTYSGDDTAFITVIFDHEVTWTGGTPYLTLTTPYTTYNVNLNYLQNPPGLTLNFPFQFDYGDYFTPGQLRWGNPAIPATASWDWGDVPVGDSYVDINMKATANVMGSGGEAIAIEIANQMEVSGSSSSGWAAVPNAPLTVTVTDTSIYCFGATDSFGNPSSTLDDIMALITSMAGSLITVSTTVSDTTLIAPLSSMYSGGSPDVNSPSGYSNSSPNNLGGDMAAFAGNSIRGATFTYTTTGSPSLSYTPPELSNISRTSI